MDRSTPVDLPETTFVNAMRLTGREWAIVGGAVMLAALVIPWGWHKLERFETGPDYRIPYALSRDYWLYQRRLEELRAEGIVVLGDSVVWGEYVRPEGAWPHFLSQEAQRGGRFVNAGVNGLFPLALEGLVRYYGGALQGRMVLLHCNLLWMSSPKADLHTEKEERFNHAGLVPQFVPRIPCYKAALQDRLDVVVERTIPLIQWVNHLQHAYFGQQSILRWTLADDGRDPPRYPNVYKNPLAQIALQVPGMAQDDPERGPQSSRHRPWSTSGAGTARFDWVDLDQSLQWAAFRRLVGLLRQRGNHLLVVVGPFNEHMLAPENGLRYRQVREGVADWLESEQVAHLVPEALPSELYADASHPLTAGYERLAQWLWANPDFQAWISANSPH